MSNKVIIGWMVIFKSKEISIVEWMQYKFLSRITRDKQQ